MNTKTKTSRLGFSVSFLMAVVSFRNISMHVMLSTSSLLIISEIAHDLWPVPAKSKKKLLLPTPKSSTKSSFSLACLKAFFMKGIEATDCSPITVLRSQSIQILVDPVGRRPETPRKSLPIFPFNTIMLLHFDSTSAF